MKNRIVALVLFTSIGAFAQDWPQWRGPNRDARAADFKAPKSWPKELTQKWKVAVGEGVATPALVSDKLYVFSREDGNEVIRCLNAADGKEVWQDKYESLGATPPAQGFSGPRSSPAVANGKVVTIGVRGTISCLDAATGKQLWRKDEFHAWPQFHPASSPLIIDGLAIAQLGGRDNGALVAYDLATGEQKWSWTGSSPSYSSPALLNVGGAKLIVAQTESKLVAINATDGKLAWEAPAPAAGGGGGGGGMRGGGGAGRYKAATPIVDGQTIIAAGAGVKAMKIEKEGDKLVSKELWSNPDKSVQFNTPVLKNGMLYGLAANNELFCINAADGKTAWAAPFPGGNPPMRGPGGGPPAAAVAPGEPGAPPPGRPGGGPGGPGGPGGGRRGGGMGGGMGGGGFGSVVDAGAVLFALTPGSHLIVFEPSGTEFKQVANYKVSDNQTHAYPIASGNRIIVKDKDPVILWTVE